MQFDYIPKTNRYETIGYIDKADKFCRFVNDFDIIGVRWSQPTTISASYFLRLLQYGSTERPRGYGSGSNRENDEASNQLSKFYSSVLDHGALWKMKNGRVICTAMPYGSKESVIAGFERMLQTFSYPETIRLQFLDDEYRFRANGSHMVAIYCDLSDDVFRTDYSDDELRDKAIWHSAPSALRHQTTVSTYVRSPYVSEYTKRRARGICQLCNQPAPFADAEGTPFLETHHVIRLADGGADSIDNTVALCPNCHRKMHILNLSEDIEKLFNILKCEEEK